MSALHHLDDGFDENDPFREGHRLPIFTGADLHGLPVPPREWLVEDLVPMHTVTLLGGDGGTGKSLLALQLAAAVAMGRPWLRRSVREGRAFYLSAEDDKDELHRRLADVVRAEDASLADADHLTLLSLAGEDAVLGGLAPGASAVSATGLFREVDDLLREEQPTLVVLDTLADLFGGNENDRAQARQFVGLLRGLALRHGCAVLMLSHPSLSGMSSGSGSSGSTGWNNSVRSRLYFERVASEGYEADLDARRLVTKKANYARTGQEIGLRWREGVFVADEPETGLDRQAKTAKAERVFLKLLRTFAEQGRHVGEATGHSYAPAKFAAHPDAEGVTKRALAAAMEHLLSRGQIAVDEKGPPSKRVKFLVEAAR